MFILKKIWAILSVAVILITGAIDANNGSAVVGGTQLDVQNFPLEQALVRAQGITTDQEYLYFSSNFFLLKTTMDGEIVCKNLSAIPWNLLKNGSNHIGGISYYNGKLYCAVEDGSDYENPYIVLFDAQTLTFTGEYYRLPQELHKDGVPWVAVDGERGVVYTAEWNNANELNVFRLEDMSFVKTIPLTGKLNRIQGAEMCGGKLYLSSDTKETGYKSVFCADPDTGEVTEVMRRYVGADTEAEGMTVLQKDGEIHLCVLDIGPARLNAFVRRYACDFTAVSGMDIAA